MEFNFDFLEEENVEPTAFLNPKIAKKQKPTRLEYLNPGERFEIVGMEAIFKNLYLVRCSSCSATVKGESKLFFDEPFKPLNKGYTMALSTSVRRI